MAAITPATSAPESFSSTFGVDPKYVVRLVAAGEGGENISFETSVDETLSISIGSQWAAPFENVMQDLAKKGAERAGISGRGQAGIGLGGQAFGLSAKNKLSSAQIWQSSDPLQLSIPFTFIAVKDPKVDVRDKVVKLLKMAAPSEILGGSMLAAPGPTLAGGKGRQITLYIGEYIKLEPIIVTDVQVQFENVIGAYGFPLRAKVTVGVKSWYSCFTTQEIDKMFVK